MDAHSGSIRCGPRRGRRFLAAAALTGCLMMNVAFAAESTSAQTLRVTGKATLRVDQPVQKSGSLSLKAYLTPKDAAIAAMPPVEEGSSYALIAKLIAKPSVCYNDTIFRDDFDGDGF
jgi:hypothetical protein